MKFRYVIERGGVEDFTEREMFCLSEATPDDPQFRVGSPSYYSVEDAKAAAEATPYVESLTWKPPPSEWLPDVVCVSQYIDDGVEENRDD